MYAHCGQSASDNCNYFTIDADSDLWYLRRMKKINVIDEIKGMGGSLREKAAILGISKSYLHDLMAGKRDPGNKVYEALGYERITTVRKRK